MLLNSTQLRPWGWDGQPVSDDDILYENGHLFVLLGDITRFGKNPILVVHGLNVGHRPSHQAYFGKINGMDRPRPMWYKPQHDLPRTACPAWSYGTGVLQGPEIEYSQVGSIGDLVPIDFLMLEGGIPAEYRET